MTAIGLKIEEPAHNAAFIGSQMINMRGAVTQSQPETGNVKLYFRWYSSLFSGDDATIKAQKFAINNVQGVEITDPTIAFTPDPPLGLGTHTISFAATDQKGETSAEQEAVNHGGLTGGGKGNGQCIIHVFRANIISPAANALLSRNGAMMDAEAPAAWGVATDKPDIYALNTEYHKVNRLQYRWQFTPVGAPAGRRPVDFTPTLDQLTFVVLPAPAPVRTIVRYQGPLYDELTGGYDLTLHVEDNQEKLGGHSMTITNVQVGP